MEFATRLTLIHQVADLLHNLTGWEFMIEPGGIVESEGETLRPDCMLRIVRGNHSDVFAIDIQRQIAVPQIAGLIERHHTYEKKHGLPALLAAAYIMPIQAEALREAGISYADLRGNLYLNTPTINIWFVGAARGLKDRPKLPGSTRQSLTTAGIRLVYHLLRDPEGGNASYRSLAEKSGISIGSVKGTVDWLRAKGFLHVVGSGTVHRSVVHREKLLRTWVEAYGERLKPKLAIGRYSPEPDAFVYRMRQEKFRAYEFNPHEASWGGETAAAKLMEHYFNPESKTIYLHLKQNLNQLLARHKLSRNPDGELEIYGAFWPPEDEDQPGIAPPLVVYADLMNSASSRCWNVAAELYKRYLKGSIENDSRAGID